MGNPAPEIIKGMCVPSSQSERLAQRFFSPNPIRFFVIARYCVDEFFLNLYILEMSYLATFQTWFRGYRGRKSGDIKRQRH